MTYITTFGLIVYSYIMPLQGEQNLLQLTSVRIRFHSPVEIHINFVYHIVFIE